MYGFAKFFIHVHVVHKGCFVMFLEGVYCKS
jgi:hypothetical protein